MSTAYPIPHVEIGRTYTALRYGGAPEARARAELGLSAAKARELEALFRVQRPGPTGDTTRPRFARSAEHVAVVLAAGGYPVLCR